MKWFELDWLGVLQVVWGVVTLILVPGLRAVYREWKAIRTHLVSLRTLVLILGNRERRGLDYIRRLLFLEIGRLFGALSAEDRERIKTLEAAGQSRREAIANVAPGLARLHDLLDDVDKLRDTALRSLEVKATREQRDREFDTTGWSPIEIDQGDLDASKEGVFREDKKR